MASRTNQNIRHNAGVSLILGGFGGFVLSGLMFWTHLHYSWIAATIGLLMISAGIIVIRRVRFIIDAILTLWR